MPPIIPDAPWWVNALLILLGLILTLTSTVWLSQIQTRKRLDSIDKQVTNDHGDRNLREDLDVVSRQVELTSQQLDDLSSKSDGLTHSLKNQDRAILDLARSVESQSDSLDRNVKLQEKIIENHVRSRQMAIDDAIERALIRAEERRKRELDQAIRDHTAACPARQVLESQKDSEEDDSSK